MPARRALSANYPWLLIGLLWMVAFLNAADRSILVAVMPQLRDEFGLTPNELALLNSVFFWIYAVAAFLSGRLGDSARRSRVIIYGLRSGAWRPAWCRSPPASRCCSGCAASSRLARRPIIRPRPR